MSPDIPPPSAADEAQAPLVPILLSLGRALGQRGRHSEAIVALRQALSEPEDKPVETVATALLAELLAAGDRESALKTCLELAPEAPTAAAASLRRLAPLRRPALVRSVASDVAIANWGPLISTTDHPAAVRRELLSFLVRANVVLGDEDRALALLGGAADLIVNDAELLMLLGDCRQRVRALGGAEAAFLRAESAAGPRRVALHEQIHVRLARVYEQLGRPENALERIDAVPLPSPDTAAEIHAVKALVLLQLGNAENAVEVVREAQLRWPESTAVAEAGACVFLSRHQYDDAAAAAEAGLNKEPENQRLSILRFQVLVEAGQDLAQIEGRMSRVLARVGKHELDDYVERSARIRSPNDAAFRYFLAMLHNALGRPADALREVDAAIRLVGTEPLDDTTTHVEVPARRLRAILLESYRPGDAAIEYAAAGQLAWEQGNFELAAELIRLAGKHQDLQQTSRWILADAIRLASYVPTEPNGVSVPRVREAIDEWNGAIEREPPQVEWAWAYVSRAMMSLQLARVEPNRYGLVTEALTYCERFYALNEGSDPFFQAFGDACRSIGLYGLSSHMFAIAVAPPVVGYLDDPPLEDLVTAAANAGDLGLMLRGIQLSEVGSATTAWHESEARYHILRREPAAARAALDAVAIEDRRPAFHHWLRTQVDWMLGDIAAVERDLAAASEVASDADAAFGLDAWLHILGGDTARALEMVAARTDEDTWLTDAAAEAALFRLVRHEPRNTDDAELRRFVAETRSYEDVGTVELLGQLLAWRYHDTPDSILANLVASARARLDRGPWPVDAKADLEHMLTTASERQDGHWAEIAAHAATARIAVAREDWAEAIAAFRTLIPWVAQFPEVDEGLSLLVDSLGNAVATRKDEIPDLAVNLDRLEATVAELRRNSRRVSLVPPEIILGDIRAQLGDLDSARKLYRSLADVRLADDVLGQLLSRQHVISVVLGESDADDLVLRAFRANVQAEQVPASTVYDTAAFMVRVESDWRKLVAAWTRVAAHAAADHDDVADDLAELSLAGRHGLAQILGKASQWMEAEAEFRAAYQGRRAQLGAEADDTLASQHALGLTLQAQGKWDQAAAEHRAVTETQQHVHGSQDPRTLAARYELAWALYNLDQFEAAEAEYRTVLDGRRQALGNDDIATLAVQRELGMTLQAQGKWEAAEAEYRVVMAGRGRTLAEDDLETLAVRYDLAWVLHNRGELAAAEAEYRMVLAGRMTALGPQDPATLAVRRQLGLVLVARDQVVAGKSELRRTVDDSVQALGGDHPETLMSRLALAQVLVDQGGWAEAEMEFREIVAAQSLNLGDEHPETLVSRFNVAMMLAKQGRLVESEAEFLSVLDGERSVLGDEDLSTHATWLELARVMAAREDWQRAEDGYRRVVALQSRMLGDVHPDTLVSRAELAAVLIELGNLTAAEAEYRAIVTAYGRELGPDGPGTLLAQYQLATTLALQGRLAEAEDEYQAVLDHERRVYGEEHSNTLITLRQLARVAAAQAQWDRAVTAYEGVVAAQSRALGEMHPQTLTARLELAEAHYNQGDLAAAEAQYRAAAEGWSATLGADHPDTVSAHLNAAVMLRLSGRLDEAETGFRNILAEHETALGEDDPIMLRAHHQLGMTLFGRGELAAAEAELLAVSQRRSRAFGEDDPSALRSRYRLAEVLAARAEWDRAEAEYRDVAAALSVVLGDEHPYTVEGRAALDDLVVRRAAIGGQSNNPQD